LVRVAKNYKLRNSITSATIDGNSWSYAYTSSVKRTATSGSYSEYQRVSPRYLPGDEIWYLPVANADIGSMVSVSDSIGSAGTPITFLDCNVDSRAWAPKVDQTTP
jgi:hypothetical protein